MRKHLILTIALAVGSLFTLTQSQETSYLAQKLMLENDLRSRINGALEKILDDHRYVLDVSVELSLTPTVKEEVTFRPITKKGAERGRKKLYGEETGPLLEAGRDRKSRLTGIPIPGFDFQIEEEPEVPTERLSEIKEEEGMEQAFPSQAQIMTQSYTDITASRPIIEKLEISCILPEGSAPELIENVRQIIMVASHFNRSRGDMLSIMTASFRERRDQRTAESIILRSIAEKIDKLEREKETGVSEEKAEVDWQEEFLQWKEEETRRREDDRAMFLAELKKLEDERVLRNLEREKKTILKRDSLKTEEIKVLKELLASAQLSKTETEAVQEEVAVKEKEIADLDTLRKKMEEFEAAMLQDTESWVRESRGGIGNLPIYLMSAISLLAVMALAAVIIFNGRKPKYVMPPPWAMPRPPRKKKVSKKPIEEQDEAKPGPFAPAPVATAPLGQEPSAVAGDPAVLQSEIKSVRQSIVSMSVGQPQTATSIVKEWLQEEAPPPPEEPAAAPEAPEEEEGKKKKK
ncbi:MAG: hypothetical protein IIA61_00230 [Candidatus Marinimicrobia bacterium]|nr:hypothetical protein [Candidatus Neomarinimicrobiota bacterium]